MFTTAVLALTLAHPAEVFEDWTLVDTVPLAEAVGVRALYVRADGDTAVLPRAVQGELPPVVHALGRTEPLPVTRGVQGWQVAMPAGDRDRVRLFARVVRPTETPRMFRLAWPHTVVQGVPVRRVVTVPRSWMDGAPQDWTCPEEPQDDVPCVSSAGTPIPLAVRVPAAMSTPRSRTMARGVLLAVAVGLSWRRAGRPERLLAAVGGAAAGLSVALSVVGARWLSWAAAVTVMVSVGALAGALAPGRRGARVAASVALVVVPVVAVLDGRARHAVPVAVLSLVAVLVGRWATGPARPDGGWTRRL